MADGLPALATDVNQLGDDPGWGDPAAENRDDLDPTGHGAQNETIREPAVAQREVAERNPLHAVRPEIPWQLDFVVEENRSKPRVGGSSLVIERELRQDRAGSFHGPPR